VKVTVIHCQYKLQPCFVTNLYRIQKSTITECEISDERKHPEVVLTNDSDLVQFCRLLTDPNCSTAQGGCSAADLLHVCTVLLPLLSCPSLSSVLAPILGPALQPVDTGTGG
jgi:hypothetical protein